MIRYERHQKIVDLLEKKNTASIKELSEWVFASEASVRRDIVVLEQMGLVRRIYGGVVLAKYKNSVVPLELRDSENEALKEEVARRAVAHIRDGMTIIMDASSTARRMIKYLDKKLELTIITNNQLIFEEETSNSFTLYCTGGLYNRNGHNFIGSTVEKYLQTVYADIMFFSAQALSDDGEISDVSEPHTALLQAMLKRSKKKVFLCDSSKLGKKRIFTVCTKDDVDAIICDKPLPWE